MKTMPKISIEELKEWVINDEGLYKWWNEWKKLTGLRSLTTFVKQNKAEIHGFVSKILFKEPVR